MNVSPRAAAVALCLAACLGVLSQYLFVRQTPGLNVVVGVAAALALAWRSRPIHARIAPANALVPIGALVFAALCAIRVDAPLVAFDVVAALGLCLASPLVFAGVDVWHLPLVAAVAAAVDASASALTGAAAVIRLGGPAVGSLTPARSSRGVAQLGGVALATPLLVIFGALFSSADAVFRHAVERAIDVAALRDLAAEMPVRMLVALLVAWIAAGWLSGARQRTRLDTRDERIRLGADTALAALLAVDALFALFVAVQVVYLFGGRETLDAAGISYSTYGRAGFFELVAAATIVVVVLLATDLVVRVRTRSYVAAALGLVALTCVVLASAAFRMELYQQAYGWSELRFYAFAGIAYIGVALAMLAWTIARASTRFAVQRLAFSGLAVAVIVNGIAPSAFVARRNIERVIDPSSLPVDASRGLDVAYLMSLGDGAAAEILALVPSVPEPDRSVLVDALRVATLRRAPLAGWQSWSVDRQRASAVIVRASAAGGGSRR